MKLLLIALLLTPLALHAQDTTHSITNLEAAVKTPEKKRPSNDAKNKRLDRKKPARDPKLASYYINFKTSPRPKTVAPVKTTLPLNIAPKTRIALIGNLLLDNERYQGHLETLIHQRYPKHQLSIRNLAWPADEIGLMPRPDNFGDLDQHLLYFKIDLIIAAFGYNESFAGQDGLAKFKTRLDKFLTNLKTKAYNGKSAAHIVLLAIPNDERYSVTQAGSRNNKNIHLYNKALEEAAKTHQLAFVSSSQFNLQFVANAHKIRYTKDGHALNTHGHVTFAKATYRSLFKEQAPTINENIRSLVLDKAYHFFHRYRPLNTFYYTGGRSKAYGYLDFLPAMRNFDLMVENRDRAIHATAAGKLTKPDDSKVPELDEVVLSRGANQWMSPADELKAFKVDSRFTVNCFASEEDFPELACPIQMRWDSQGRLWVSCSTTYPHVYPGQKPNDKIIILEDTDADGKADKCSTFADDLHIPLSFVLDGKGGVICSEQPHLTHLHDTDGDGKADRRDIIFTGFGCEDSHHSIHDFTWTPGGDLLFRESVFHNTQVETPYGPVRTSNSSWFLYNPTSQKLSAFGSYPNTNPWGVTFDKWGNHVASHPVFAPTFHATNPPYPRQLTQSNGFSRQKNQHPGAKGMQAYSGVCGHDFIDFPSWPKEMQGGFLKARYKPTNRIEIHRWVEKDDCFEEKYVGDLIFSSNLSFIPVDLRFGPRGAAYVCDWYNPVKGHMQYSLRDPRRDRKSGRIWRIVPKGSKLQNPPKIAGASIVELLELLKSPHYRVRYWAKRELRARDNRKELIKALDQWTAKQNNPFHLIEALWMFQGLNTPRPALMDQLIKGSNHLLAASAFGPLRFWHENLSPQQVAELLRFGATHTSQHVRREAVICASYIATENAFQSILPVLELPSGTHLSYAIRSSFNSKALATFWQSSEKAKDIRHALASLSKKPHSKPTTQSPKDNKFDSQQGLQTVNISCVPERLQFDQASFTVKAGKPVKLVFSNPDATQHNLLILDIGTPLSEIGMAANDMAKTPEGSKKHYIPNDKRILHHSKLLQPESVEIMRFIAPRKKGKYPYVCTFPGHWTVMKGVMIVR